MIKKIFRKNFNQAILVTWRTMFKSRMKCLNKNMHRVKAIIRKYLRMSDYITLICIRMVIPGYSDT